MADSVNVRIEDDEGNKYYVQTTAENVLLKDGSTLESKMNRVGVVHIINKNELSDNQAYRIAKFDLSKFVETDFGGNYSPDIYVQLLSWKFGYQYLFIRPLWANSSKRILLVVGTSHIETNSNIMINDNIKDVFNFSKIDDNTIGIYYSPSTLSIAKEDAVKIISYTVHGVKTYEPEDNIVVDWTCVKESIASLHLSGFSNYELDFNRIFTPNDDSWIGANGIVPHPTTSEADNKYLLGADAKWHPRKTGNEYIANLKPTEEIKGLSETDTTKGISFVTFDFNALSQKVIEAAPSTVQEFDINMEILVKDLGIIIINASFSVTTAGLVACNGVLSDRGMGRNSVSFSTSYSGKLGAVTTPGFFVNDKDTKICKIALYTPIAIDGVKIIDAVVTSYSDIIDESDIVFTWELGILEKKPYKPLRSDIIYPRIALDRELVFDQMNIETPISETDEDTLFAEQIKHNGLVPAPGKYEAENKYLLGADAKWHPRKAGNEYIANLKPTEEILGLTETDTTKGVSFVTIDFNALSQKIVEATPSTYQEFDINMEILVRELGIIIINASFSVTKAGVIACKGVTSNRGLNSGNFSITFDSKIGSIPSPGFFVNDYDTKIFKLALYTVFANNGVKIIEAQITSYSDLIDENDIICTWELGVLDKLPAQIGKSNEIYLGVDLPRDQTFRQMNIETPIAETEETTVEAEQLKYNGLVPAPGKYEVENQYFLKADGTWDLPKNTVQNVIATVTPTDDMISQVEAAKTTKLISFLTIDVNEVASSIEKTERFTFSMNVLTINFGLVRIGFTIIINTRGDSNISNFNSDLGTDMLPVQLTRIYNLKDYGVETMSPIFGISDSSNKGIFNIGINGSSMKGKVIVLNISCIPSQTTLEYKPFKYIFEPTLIDLDSSATIRRVNSSLIGSMDPSNVFGPITEITSEEIANETDPYELKMKKLRKNGLVPAPYQYEVDNGYYLKADGSWDLPKRGNNNFISIVTPSEEMTSQVSSTVGITFATFDYSKIIENLSLAVNTGSGFEGVLIINTKLFGEILINFSVSLFNLNGTINKGATACANVGTKSAVHISQISLIQNTYGADIKTPVFIYTDSVNNICKIGLYGTASKSPVIIKDCTLNQTYTDFDVNDITITWEPTTITISEENTNDASLFTNMDWSKTFTPMRNMTDPDGSYSENNIRRWKLQNNGLVPAPTKYEADQGKVLRADGTWGYQHPPIIECSSIENSENLILTSEGEEILEELLSTPCFNFVIKLHGLSTETFTATSQFAITKNDRYIKLYDAATSEAIVVLKGGSYVYVTIIKVSENIYHGMCIRHNYNVDETNK